MKHRSRPLIRRSSRKRLKPTLSYSLPAGVEQHVERALGDPLLDLLVLAHLDQLEPRVAREQPLIVLHVVGERRPQPPDRDHEEPHGARED